MTTEDLVSLCDAVKALGVPRTTLRRWIGYGMPHMAVGCHTKLHLDAARRWMAEHRPAGKRGMPFVAKVADDPNEAGIVYAWKHPHTGQIRYVGKTHNLYRRLIAYRHKVHSPHLRNWFASLQRDGLEPELMILQECDGHLSRYERWWIAHGRACGWNLINKTDGGDGGTGFSDDVRKAMSEKSKAKWKDPEYVKHWRDSMAAKGRLLTDEEKKRREEAAKVDRLVAVAWKAWSDLITKAERQRRRESQQRLSRTIVVDGKVARVPLTHGQWALIDAEDALRVGTHLWSCQYKRNRPRVKTNINKQCVLLNRFVMNARDGEVIGFRNGDWLDCRKRNLVRIGGKVAA